MYTANKCIVSHPCCYVFARAHMFVYCQVFVCITVLVSAYQYRWVQYLLTDTAACSEWRPWSASTPSPSLSPTHHPTSRLYPPPSPPAVYSIHVPHISSDSLKNLMIADRGTMRSVTGTDDSDQSYVRPWRWRRAVLWRREEVVDGFHCIWHVGLDRDGWLSPVLSRAGLRCVSCFCGGKYSCAYCQ